MTSKYLVGPLLCLAAACTTSESRQSQGHTSLPSPLPKQESAVPPAAWQEKASPATAGAEQIAVTPVEANEIYCRDTIYGKYLQKTWISKASRGLPRHVKGRRLRRMKRRHTQRAKIFASDRLLGHLSSDPAGLPITMDPKVIVWLDYFQSEVGRRQMLKWLVRSATLSSSIQPLLVREGLPKELFFLAMIESGLSNRAFSRAKASGTWQFMKATARSYGLKINYWVDERRNPLKSTVAAARYLRDLYKRFGDWYLAIAAYNAGPGKIRYAMRKSGSRQYWRLARTRWLRAETRNYVPKMLAAFIMASHPRQFGFDYSGDQAHQVPVHQVRIDNPIKIRELARKLGIPLKKIRDWNPELVRNIVPPAGRRKSSPYMLHIPLDYHEKTRRILPGLAKLEIKDVRMHRIRRGDTLRALAKKYGVPVKKILSINPRIKPTRLRIGKKIAIPIPNVVIRRSRRPA